MQGGLGALVLRGLVVLVFVFVVGFLLAAVVSYVATLPALGAHRTSGPAAPLYCGIRMSLSVLRVALYSRFVFRCTS